MQADQTAGAFSVTGAANYLGISRSGLYRLIDAGAIPVVKIGARTLFRRVDLDEFLAANVAPAGVR